MRIQRIGTVIVARKTAAIEAWENYGIVCTDLTTTYGSASDLAYFLAKMTVRRDVRIVIEGLPANPTVADMTRCLQDAYRQAMGLTPAACA